MVLYTAGQHWTYTILGLILLIVIVFTLRMETAFLAQSRRHWVQFVLSLISIFIMIFLTVVLLFHWSLYPIVTFTALILLVPVLLILAPIILYLRYRTFKGLLKERKEDRRKLVKEVIDLIDEKKREKIREGKIARSEPLDD